MVGGHHLGTWALKTRRVHEDKDWIVEKGFGPRVSGDWISDTQITLLSSDFEAEAAERGSSVRTEAGEPPTQ